MISDERASENAPPPAVCPSGGASLGVFEIDAALTDHLSRIAQRLDSPERISDSSGLGLRHGTTASPKPNKHVASPWIDVGPLRVAIDSVRGSRVDLAGAASAASGVPAPRPLEVFDESLPQDARPETTVAVWEALAGVGPTVRIDGAPGSGATTLLRFLARDAAEHGYPRVVVAGDVDGPAGDVAERIAAALELPSRPHRHTLAALHRIFDRTRALVLLDRVDMTPADVADLRVAFPECRFVLAGAGALAPAATVALEPLSEPAVLTMLESSYHRPIDAPDRLAALGLCSSVGALPGRIRLIGVAAREFRCSFTALDAQFGLGDAVVRAFVASLPAEERRILGVLTLARVPLAAHHLAFILRSVDIGAALERLVGNELLRPCSPGSYELPRYVAPLVATVDDADAVFARIVETVADVLDSWTDVPVLDRQLAAAEAFVDGVAERGRCEDVFALGFRLAERFAARGAFGAWGRVLVLLERAALRAGNADVLGSARHELGVRALLLGESERACAYLHAAARDRGSGTDFVALDSTAFMEQLADDLPDASTDSSRMLARQLRVRAEGTSRTVRTMSDAAPLEAAEVLAAPAISAPAVAALEEAAPAEALPAPPESAQTSEADLAVDLPRARADDGRAGASAAAMPPVGLPAPALFAAGLTLAAAVIGAIWLRSQPAAPPRIVQFTADRVMLAGTGDTQLCVESVGTSVVEVFPDALRLPGSGKRCVTVHPLMTTTYVAVGTAADGRQIQRSLTVDAADSAYPRSVKISAFAANPPRIRVGQSTRLCYAVSGAHLLHIVPQIGKLTRLHACQTVTLREPHPFRYALFATGEYGQVASRQLQVDVLPISTPHPVSTPTAVAAATPAADSHTERRAIFQFDATPSVVERGQAASLCVGVERPAHAWVTQIGSLQAGITRCYLVAPNTTTVYRLHVILGNSTTVESVTVAVRSPSHGRDVARSERERL